MYTIHGRNVNEAWPTAISLLLSDQSVQTETRAGLARVVQTPVATVYERPTERVLFDAVRDANPIFHHMEALWMLAGRDDATWLDQFVSDFSKRFAEDGGRMHGAYGKRWRSWFDHPGHTGDENSIHPAMLDQLDECVRLLRDNPNDRQAVIQMWDPSADLGVPGLRDRPCNQQILLRADRCMIDLEDIDTTSSEALETSKKRAKRYLDITVTNRSNDAVYGAYGANAYHMSVLQEYLAARIGVEVGTYIQFSNNLHMYDWSMKQVDLKVADEYATRTYPGTKPLVDDPGSFDHELRLFLENPEEGPHRGWLNSHFPEVAWPLYLCNRYRKNKDWDNAIRAAGSIAANDLRHATLAWVRRRAEGAEQKKETRE